MLNFVIGDGQVVAVEGLLVYLPVFISLAISLVLYILRSIGIYTLSRRNGVKSARLAWIPFLWIYPTCKLIGNIRIFGRPIRNAATLFTVIFTVCGVLSFAYNVATYIPLIGYYLQGGTVYMGGKVAGTIRYLGDYYVDAQKFINPFNGSLAMVMNIVYYVIDILDIANIFITITIYFDLFRKFWPEHYILAAIASIFGLFDIFVFIIRKKQPIDYADYVRRRYGNPYGPNGYYGRQGGYGQGYNQGYGSQSNGTQGQPNQEEKTQKPENPFPEFDDKK